MEKILAGSHVYHKPTGENWVVALDEIDGRIYYMGYPFGGYGDKKDVALLRETSPEKRKKTLEEVYNCRRNPVMAARAERQLTENKL